jgi:hypothetical protein
MNDYDPGPGWREVDTSASSAEDHTLRLVERGGRILQAWVREESVSPLPTEPYTVIRVTSDIDELKGDYALGLDRRWWSLGRGIYIEYFGPGLTAFEVLAEPRAVTAKAVLDRIASEPWAREIDLTKWATEFGVTS